MVKSICGALILAFSLSAFSASIYPQKPDAAVTPGAFCTHATEYRYPEHIAYCKRSVSGGEKKAVIAEYNQRGYRIEPSDRSQFKIDHYVPLCAGGSNDRSNLWPQHQTVYNITDPLEGLACEKMAAGKIEQKRAVDLLMRAKNNLDQVPAVQAIFEAL